MIPNTKAHTQLHEHVAFNIFLDNWTINPGAKFNNHTSIAAVIPMTIVKLSTVTLTILRYRWYSVLHYLRTHKQ